MLEPTRASSKTYEELTNYEKAAIVLIALGKEVTSQIMRYLPEQEIEVLSLAIARMRNIDQDVELQVLQEFYATIKASEFLNEGGIDYAREVLEGSLGKSRAVPPLFQAGHDPVVQTKTSSGAAEHDYRRKDIPE